ncbi:SIR2-like domain-containing protein [Azotobacter beijerinckii]|uniref:SIR2-like domain-containing protein n=1 Tax=Azotobacter beijerinckii TaxID=170623 RepID=A0A1H6UL06_9GAMM|nr:SIR2 family protein [Azotobacter beijerinckii]SEI88625.1 SIR2-like domain-containing protein [Azotobacter beijerinckii]SEI93043.1 SIR2-like domain-containing protein [Azotobacter beijerinckii]
MNNSLLKEILAQLGSGEIVPYLGQGVLRGVVDRDTGKPIPADSDSLILAMTGGQPMSPRLMYEFSRAAMHLENKKGRSFIERFLTQVYGSDNWTPSPVHQWLTDLDLPYIIDCNRDTQLQHCYIAAERKHTLVVGAARLAATPYRFDLYHFEDGKYRKIALEQVDTALPVIFKPHGTPLPKPGYVASDADFVDYITELMGGFAIPDWIKLHRKNKRYLFLGQHFNRDTERMVMSDMIYDAAEPAGWVLIDQPSDKERKVCERKNLQLIEADWSSLLALANPSATEVA